jgi:hypothetical protein
MVPLTVFCQIQPEPKSYQKIKFVYQKKSNFKLDENGLYADTTQLKVLFPEVEYEKINSNTGNIIGFVPHSKLNRLHQKTIAKKMTENNTVIFGLVDLKKNNVLFSIDHSSPETDMAYQLFKLPQNKLNSSLYYTYKKKFTLLEMNSNATTQVKSIVKNKIRWQNDKQTIGHYDTQDKSEHKQLNVVIFQEDLPRLVSPIPLFENAKAGIKTIYAMEYHYELIAVSYE